MSLTKDRDGLILDFAKQERKMAESSRHVGNKKEEDITKMAALAMKTGVKDMINLVTYGKFIRRMEAEEN